VFGFFSKLIFLFFLVAGSFFAFLSTDQIKIENSLESNENIYSVKNAEFFGSDQKGSLTYKVFSKNARSENAKDQIILDQVDLLYYSDDSNSWKISSDKGEMYDDSDILVLSGNVVIRNNSTLRPSIIETEYLEINPNKMTIATNKRVKITLNNNTIEAFGINATLDENKIKFRASSALTSMD
tara:strand:- start:60 stop:608 length:549 start_codon:yes stop_codon:yes gene_type:complete